MADNRVIIYVVSENRTKAGFDQAKKDAEDAGDAAGQGFMSKFASWLVGGSTQFGGGGIGGILSTAFSGGLPGIAVLTVAISGAITLLDALATGFTAAAAGAGAFFLLGHNTITNLMQDFQAYTSAQNALQLAQNKAAISPTKTNLADVQKAQVALQAVQMSMTQDAGSAAGPMQKMAETWSRITQAFQPEVFKVLADVFTLLNQLMPLLVPLATAFADALDKLLKQAEKFASSKQFHQWFEQFVKVVGPATMAIGKGLGEVTIAFGKLLVIMSNKDVVTAIRLTFDVITAVLKAIAGNVELAMKAWDIFWTHLKGAAEGAKHSFTTLYDAFKWAFDGIENLIVGVIRWMEHAGADIVNGIARGIDSATGGLLSKIGGLASSVIRHFTGLLGISSPSTVFAQHGRNIVAGLVQGIDQSAGSASSAIGRLAASGGGGFAGGGGGSQLVMNWGSPQTQALVRMLWPNLQLEVRNRGGGGKNSAQIALGQVH